MRPADTNTEELLIGAALRFPEDAEEISRLEEHDFDNDICRKMFKVFKDMYVGDTVDWIEFARRCGVKYSKVQGLINNDGLISGAQIPGLIKKIRDLSKRRAIIEAGNLMQTKAENYSLDVNELLSNAARYIEDAAVSEQKEPVRMIEAIEKVVDGYVNNTRQTGIQSDLVDLDYFWSGLYPGELTVLAGRPSMGKTQFAQYLALKAAGTTKKPVIFFSLEMTTEDLCSRYIATELGTDVDSMRRGKYGRSKLEKEIGHLLEKFARYPIYIQDEANLTTYDIYAQCRQLKKREGLSLIIIDYLTLLNDSRERGDTEALKITDMTRRIAAMAKSLKIPVLVLAQLSRKCEMRENKKPILSDLKESGGIEERAENVLLLYRNEYYNPDKPDHVLEINIAKQKQGARGVTAEVYYNAGIGKFDNLARHNEPPAVMAGGKQY